MINMQKLEDEKIYKWCETESKKGDWIRTHVKFLKGGDRFFIGDQKFLATSEPYFYEPAKREPTTMRKLLHSQKNSGWTIRFVKD